MLPRPCTVALSSMSPADLVPVEGCPEQQPHSVVQSCVVLLHRVRGRQAAVRGMLASCSAGPSAGLAISEFFCVATEPRKPLMIKILVCQEAFILGMLTGIFFQPQGSHTTLFVCLPVLHQCMLQGGCEPGCWRVQGLRVKRSGREGKCLKNVKGSFLRLKLTVFDYGSSLRQ